MIPEDRFRRRLSGLLIAIAIAGLCVVARLLQIQLLEASDYRARARGQHEATVRLEGQRGSICDRNGRELAASLEVDSAFVHPWQLSDPEATSRVLASALGLERRSLSERLAQPKPFVWVKRKITPEERRRIEALPLKGLVHFTRESKRFYPKGTLASHILGFVGTDGTGLEGLERDFDSTIRGEGGSFVVLRDAKGGAILQQVRRSARTGASLELTIDETIQHAAEAELEDVMDSSGAKKGAIIVADPRTGEILALVSRPAFDPNLFSKAPAIARKNVGIGDRYEPGSTFKIITAAAGLEEGRVRPGDWFDCGEGSIVVNTIRIRDHHPYGSLTFTDVIAKSSNVGIIRLGLRLGAATLHEYTERFGFGRATGLGLSGEAEGIVARATKWSSISVASVSMGQEILVTPIQMLQAFSAIANGGVMTPPCLVRAVGLPDGRRVEMARRPTRRVISAATARTLTGMMEQVVEDGTGKAAAVPGYHVAGKTGTAQKIAEDGRYSHSLHTASFIGFAPASDPKVAAIVVLDEPKGLYYGGEVAAPSFSRVVSVALETLRVRPDDEFIPPAPEFFPPRIRETLLASSGGKTDLAAVARAAERSRRGLPVATRAKKSSKGNPKQTRQPIEWPPSHDLAPDDSPSRSTDVSSDAMPDLYGLSLRDSLARLSDRGFRFVSYGTGFVVQQDPEAGARACAGTLCRLILSLRPPDTGEAESTLSRDSGAASAASYAARGETFARTILRTEPRR